MATRYKINLKDQSGTLVALITDWKRCDIRHVLNGISEYSLQIDGESSICDLFELDGQIEIYRQDIENNIDWTLEFEGFHRSESRKTEENGDSTYTSYGVGYNHLLSRRIILYNSSSVYTDKSGVGETVMKAYVDENAGPSATNPPRLLEEGTMTGLSIEADGAAGANWEGAKAFQKLLDVCQEIGNATGIDFGIVGVGAALFEFQARALWGDDRSTTGLDSATGLNGAGNAPVVFSLVYGNMAAPEYSLNRAQEVTAVISMGEGLSSNRLLALRTDAARIAESTWNLCESSRGASNEYTTAQLESGGDAFLEDNQAKESFIYKVMQIPGCLYGKDYFLGDLVTARYKAIERNKKIVGVNITLEAGKEDISVVLSDVK